MTVPSQLSLRRESKIRESIDSLYFFDIVHTLNCHGLVPNFDKQLYGFVGSSM